MKRSVYKCISYLAEKKSLLDYKTQTFYCCLGPPFLRKSFKMREKALCVGKMQSFFSVNSRAT